MDFISVRHFEIAIEWVDPVRSVKFPAVFLVGYDFLFALASAFGLVTLSVLGCVREEDESNRDAVMSELAAQTRENLQVLNSVPGMNVIASLPLTTPRYIPAVVDLDVEAGVTAYQLAASIRSVATTAARSGATAKPVQDQATQATSRVARDTEQVGRNTPALAFGAVQGAIQAAVDTGLSAGRLYQASITGGVSAGEREPEDPLDLIRGAIHGAIHGGSDAGLPMGVVASSVIRAVQHTAPELRPSEHEAASFAAQTVVEAAEVLPATCRKQVTDAVVHALVHATDDKRPHDDSPSAR